MDTKIKLFNLYLKDKGVKELEATTVAYDALSSITADDLTAERIIEINKEIETLENKAPSKYKMK